MSGEVAEIIKLVQKYQAAISEVASTGEKIAAIMIRVGEGLPDNEHGTKKKLSACESYPFLLLELSFSNHTVVATALTLLGEQQLQIESLRRNWVS